MSNEEKWRESFKEYYIERGYCLPQEEYEWTESIYIAARKTAQLEIDEITNECNSLAEELFLVKKQLRDRDEKIERLRTRALTEAMGDMKTHYEAEIDRLRNEIAMIDGASKDEIERLKKELHAYQGRENLAYDLMGELKERDELLLEGVKYMREGHLKFTPTVTSSLVLDWIEKVNKILGEQK